MKKHILHNKDERTQFFRKIYLSLYLKGFERITKGIILWEVSWRLNRTATYWSTTLLATAAFLFCSPGLLNRGPGGPASAGTWFSFQHLTPTDLNFLSPGLYNNLISTYFLRSSHLYLIQPVDSQGYPLISSTGFTCYLHWCISHLTARPGRKSICYTEREISY